MSIQKHTEQALHAEKVNRRTLLASTAVAGTAVAASYFAATAKADEVRGSSKDSGELKQFGDVFGTEVFLEADNTEGATPKALVWAEVWQRGVEKPTLHDIAAWLSREKEVGVSSGVENAVKIRFHWAHLGQPKYVETSEAPPNMCYLLAWVSWDKHDAPTAAGIPIPC